MCDQENMIVIHVNDRAVLTVNSEAHVSRHHVPCCPGRNVSYTSNTMYAIMK